MIVLHACRGNRHGYCPKLLRHVAPSAGLTVCACVCHNRNQKLIKLGNALALVADAVDGLRSTPRDHAAVAAVLRDVLDRPYRHLRRQSATFHAKARRTPVTPPVVS